MHRNSSPFRAWIHALVVVCSLSQSLSASDNNDVNTRALSEQLGLLWQDVDLDRDVITIRRVQERDGTTTDQTKTEAGERDIQRSANVEAVGHLTHGLELAMSLPATPERLQLELKLHRVRNLCDCLPHGYAVVPRRGGDSKS